MGPLPKHASTVPMLLNPNTGKITAQFHVVFDDWFQTVVSTNDDVPNIQDPIWTKLFSTNSFHYKFDEEDSVLTTDLLPPLVQRCVDAVSRAMDLH